jgi:hypothetical protein
MHAVGGKLNRVEMLCDSRVIVLKCGQVKQGKLSFRGMHEGIQHSSRETFKWQAIAFFSERSEDFTKSSHASL